MKKVVKFVPLWKRIVAFIFDSILISLIITTPLMANDTGESFAEVMSLVMTVDFWIATFIIGLLTLLYWTFLEWKFGQSVGKVLMKIKVVNIEEKEISFWQALVRNLSKLSMVILFLDVLYMLLGRGYQRFFEKISETKVMVVVEK